MAMKPTILLVNDDGVYSPAIKLLQDALSDIGEVYVVAPDRDKSGSSHSLTLSSPLHLTKLAENIISVQGTPADCVHLAATGLLPKKPDICISGVNLGPNLGSDVLYSGTVAAAFEASTCNIPALAFSITESKPQHLNTAVDYVVAIVAKYLAKPLPVNIILNINIPDIPSEDIKGVLTTKLGSRAQSHPAVEYKSPRGHNCYWIGKPGLPDLTAENTDFAAIEQGFISVSPLQIDMTKHEAIADISNWLHGK
jgi:5'-nucleotidase